MQSFGRKMIFGAFLVLSTFLLFAGFSIWHSTARTFAQQVDLAHSRILPASGQSGTPVINCPYSLVRTTVVIEGKTDSERAMRVRTEYEERDERGRTRTVSGIIQGQSFKPMTILLNDPASGTTATLFPGSHEGILSKNKPFTGSGEECGRWNKYVSDAASGTNGLPSIVVDGVKGFGSRHTINPKLASGLTYAVTEDTWTAEDLHIPLRTETVDPGKSQEITTMVSSLRRSNPPANDFEIPPEYKIAPDKQ